MKKIDETTKDKIMQAALFIFANEGYRNATVRKICELAEVNVAAVNYHFGDKLNLYRTLRRYINENGPRLTMMTRPITLSECQLELQKWLQKIFSAIRNDENMAVKYALMIYMREQVENPMSNQENSTIFDNYAPRNQYFYLLESIIKCSLHYENKDLEVKLLSTSVLGLTIFYLTNQDFIKNLTEDENFIQNNESKIIEMIVNQTSAEINILNQQHEAVNEQ